MNKLENLYLGVDKNSSKVESPTTKKLEASSEDINNEQNKQPKQEILTEEEYKDFKEYYIKDSYSLLEKLKNKKIWDKETLIVGADKSVRPLAYILKKLSDEKKLESPKFTFLNYSIYDDNNQSTVADTEIPKLLKIKIGEKKLSEFRKYKKVLILDHYTYTGETLAKMGFIVNEILNNPSIKFYYATLEASQSAIKYFWSKQLFYPPPNPPEIIYTRISSDGFRKSSYMTGIEDKRPSSSEHITESIRVNDKKIYKEYVQNRKKINLAIKEFLKNEIHP